MDAFLYSLDIGYYLWLVFHIPVSRKLMPLVGEEISTNADLHSVMRKCADDTSLYLLSECLLLSASLINIAQYRD